MFMLWPTHLTFRWLVQPFSVGLLVDWINTNLYLQHVECLPIVSKKDRMLSRLQEYRFRIAWFLDFVSIVRNSKQQKTRDTDKNSDVNTLHWQQEITITKAECLNTHTVDRLIITNFTVLHKPIVAQTGKTIEPSYGAQRFTGKYETLSSAMKSIT
jgi:hypothetical protein